MFRLHDHTRWLWDWKRGCDSPGFTSSFFSAGNSKYLGINISIELSVMPRVLHSTPQINSQWSEWLGRPARYTLNSHEVRCHTCQRSAIYLEWFPFTVEDGCSKSSKPQGGLETSSCQFYCSANHLKHLIKWLYPSNLDSCWKDSDTVSKLNRSFSSGGFNSPTASSFPHFITFHFPDRKKKDISYLHPNPEVLY